MLLLILVGLLLGPVTGFLRPEDFGKVGPVMTTLTLIAILLESGTNLSIDVLRRAAGPTLSLTLVTFVVTLVAVSAVGMVSLGLPWLSGLTLGAILAGTSSAVVIPMVKGLKIGEPAGTMMVLESALTDVLCIVVAFAFLQAHGQGVVEPGRIIGGVFGALLLSSVLGVLGAMAWLAILWNVQRYPATLATTFGFALLLYGLGELLGFSGAITVLAFGVALANHEPLRLTRVSWIHARRSKITEAERAFHQELVFVLKTFFFVYLGLSIRMESSLLLIAVAGVGVVYLLRLAISRLTLPRVVNWRDAAITSVMIPKGLAAAVLAGLPVQAGMTGGAVIQNFSFLVVLTSIVLTSLLVPATTWPGASTFYRRFFGGFPDPAVAPPPSTTTASDDAATANSPGQAGRE